MDNQNIIIRVATPDDVHYAETITNEMAESAKARGTGIAKRSPEYVADKMKEGKAVIAVTTRWHMGWFLLYRNMESWRICCQQRTDRCTRHSEKAALQKPSRKRYLIFQEKNIPIQKFLVLLLVLLYEDQQ